MERNDLQRVNARLRFESIFNVLMSVAEGASTTLTIAHESGLSPSSLRRYLQLMVRTGLVSHSKHGPFARYSMTESGDEALAHCMNMVDNSVMLRLSLDTA
jgi:predicted transcriptional regulator